jgi:hypothetical protein
MTKRYIVQESRESPYSEPVILTKGEAVTVGEEYKEKVYWPGWIWCETADKKCWVPFQTIEKKQKNLGIMKEDYNATELNVKTGDIIEAEKELNGWVWGKRSGDNRFGWVPMDILKEEDTD